MNKLLKLVLIFSFILIMITGCEFKEEKTLEDKMEEEIKYTENELVGIVNNFTFEKYLQEDDENKLLQDTRNLEEASNRIMVDLATENIDNSEITNFGEGINKMIDFANNYQDNEYLVELNNLFSLLPNFEAKISNDSDKIFESRLKYYTISSYIAYLVGDFELAKTQVQTLENEFLEKQKSAQYVEEHKYNMNKIYLLIKELKNGIEQDSITIVKEKYLLLIDEI